eukprot:2259899-Amphidinium_carterae.1
MSATMYHQKQCTMTLAVSTAVCIPIISQTCFAGKTSRSLLVTVVPPNISMTVSENHCSSTDGVHGKDRTALVSPWILLLDLAPILCFRHAKNELNKKLPLLVQPVFTPPGATSTYQPLDIALFGSIKSRVAPAMGRSCCEDLHAEHCRDWRLMSSCVCSLFLLRRRPGLFSDAYFTVWPFCM